MMNSPLRPVVLGLALLVGGAGLVAQEPQSDPVATRKYSVALGFQKKQLYDQAAERWQEFIKAYPQDKRIAIATHHFGVCQIQQQKFAEAAATFRAILAQYPQFPALDSAQFNLGLALYNAALATKAPADFQAAVAVFAELPAKYPESQLKATALYYQAECQCLAGDLAGAVPVYQRVIGEYPQSPLLPQVYYSLGATLQDLKKDDEAVSTLQTLVQKYPQDAVANDGRLRLAESLFHQAKYADAQPLFLQLSKAEGFSQADVAMLKHAQTLFELGKVAEAAAEYEALPKAFAASSNVGLALLSGGQCRYRAEQYPQAQADFVAAVQGKSESAPEAAFWLGRTLVRLAKPMEAVQALDQAIAEYPQSNFLPLCKYARVEALLAIDQRRAEAVALFAQFAAEYPQHEKAPEALYRAAAAALELADYPAARNYCDTFLKNPVFSKNAMLANVLLTAAESHVRGTPPDPAAAETFFRRLVAEFPQDTAVPRAELGIGACLHAQQKFQPALDHLTKSAAVFKDPILLAESRLLIGRCHLDSGRAAEAVAALRSALEAKPDWQHADEVLLVLSASLQAAGQLDAAIAELNKLLASHPNSNLVDQAIYQLGQIHSQKKEYDPAIAQYQRLISQVPASPFVPAAWYGTGAAQFEKKELRPAIASLDKLVTEHAASELAPRGKYLRGICRLELAEFAPGATDLTEFLAAAPNSPDAPGAKFALARCQAGLKQYDAAIAGLNALLQEQPEYARADDVYYELAFAYFDANKPPEASATFLALATKLPMSPHAAESWYRVGEFRELAGQLEEAAKAYDAGLKGPGNPEVREKLYFQLGSVQYKLGQFPQAIVTLQTQVKESAAGNLVHAATYLIGDSLFQQKKYAEALPQFAAVIGAQDERARQLGARALYRSGICSANLQDWKASQQHYGTLIERFPDFELIAEARYGLGFALQNQQQFDPARAAFKVVTESAPSSETAAKSWFMMGQCWFAEKKYAEAIACFSEVAFGFKHDEWQPLSYFEAGRCYVQLNNPDAARKMLTAVVQEFPKHPRANDAQTILKQLDQEKK